MATRRSHDQDPSPTHEKLAALVSRLDAPLAANQRRQLVVYLEHLLRWNRVHNLTGIHDLDLLVFRHVAESLALAPLMEGERIADLGSGAGLPGLILAASEPGRQFWLMESVGKKARFLVHAVGAIGLGNVTVYHGRVEDFRVSVPFDTVVARALAPLDRLVQLARHLLGEHGKLVALKGQKLEAELATLPAGFRVETIEVLASLKVNGPPPRAVVIRPDSAA